MAALPDALSSTLNIPTAQLPQHTYIIIFEPATVNMNRIFDCGLGPLGQVISDSLHREECIWTEGNGKQCRNTVSKASRMEGALCFQTFQDLSLNFSTTQKLAFVGKFLLCSECKRHRCN